MGGDLSFFIDKVKADESDLKAIQPKDVLRIEYLENPTDAAFAGCPYVLNFVMKKYQWGGYTKLNAMQSFIDVNGFYGLFSKFKSARMTYDLATSANYNRRDLKSNLSQEYSGLRNDMDGTYSVDRITSNSGILRNNNYGGRFRALYSYDNNVFYTTLALGFSHNPGYVTSGSLRFEPPVYSSLYQRREEYARSISPSLSAVWSHSFNNTTSLNTTVGVQHSHNYASNLYSPEGLQSIYNHVSDNNWGSVLSAYLSHRLNKRLSVGGGGNISYEHYSTLYSGDINSDPRQTLSNLSANLSVNMRYIIRKGFNVVFRPGVSFLNYKSNGNNVTEWKPDFSLSSSLTINPKNQISFKAGYQSLPPSPAYTNSSLIQINEIEWLRGNPDLKGVQKMRYDLRYTWMPNNLLSLNTLVNYSKEFHLADEVWTPEEDKMIRSYFSNGWHQSLYTGIDASLNLLGSHIRLNGSCSYIYSKIHGAMDRSIGFFSPNFSVSGYYGACFFGASYKFKSHSVWNNEFLSIPQDYYFYAGFAKGDFNLSLMLSDIFTTRALTKYWVKTPYYYSTAEEVRPNTVYTQSVSINMTYTFGYGKKISRGNEIDASTSGASAILK